MEPLTEPALKLRVLPGDPLARVCVQRDQPALQPTTGLPDVPRAALPARQHPRIEGLLTLEFLCRGYVDPRWVVRWPRVGVAEVPAEGGRVAEDGAAHAACAIYLDATDARFDYSDIRRVEGWGLVGIAVGVCVG